MLKSRVCEAIGIRYPIFQGGMAWVSDGKLAADQYDCGFPWRIPASLLAGKECYLVMSPRYDRVYRED